MRHTRQLLVMIYALCLAVVMQAQTPVSVTPVTSTEGYDFVATFLPNGSSLIDAADLKLQFLVSSRVENVVAVQYGDGSYGEDVTVAAGSSQVIEVEAKKAYWDITNDETETKLNKGIRIFSRNGAKMTVYAVNQIGTDKSTFSTDGAHVLPKQALGHEYIVSCNSADVLASEFVVMSTTAGTTVKITLPDKMKTSKGKSELAVTFDKPYQIYIVRSQPADPKDPTISMDLSGTTICADHPVAVWSGNQAARFTTDQPNAAADYAFDQLLPIDRWGTQFIVPMTGLNTRLNKLDIVARDAGTKVKITTSTKPNNPETKELASKEKWSKLIDAYHGQESNFSTLQDSVYVVTADKPIEVHLYTSSSVYNVDRNFKYQGDPSMTMISPVEYLTDTAVFSTFHNPQKDAQQMSYELVVWAKKTTVSKLKLNGIGVNTGLFKNLPGSAFSGYQYARIPIEEGYHLLTADDKGFGGYVCGLEDGQAVLYPVGYDITPVEDSLFLSKKYEPKEVHGGEFNAKYPDKGNGGGWYLDKVVLPNQPTQYDTIFICDSTKLRFPVLIRNKWNEIKWEVMRIDRNNQKRSEYTHEGPEYEYETGDLSNPFLQTRFFVQPEKHKAAGSRPKYEDFEVRAILYREPVLCGETDINKWQKDTLSTIVRTYRSYNDTTWLIRCTNDTKDLVAKDGKYYIKFFKAPGATEPELTEIAVGENMTIPTHKYTTVNGCENDSIVTLRVLLCESDVKPTVEKYLCEDELEGIHSELDGFFPNYDFYEKLQTCKKNKQGDGKWTWNSGQLRWDFTDTDIRRTTDCNADMERWHNTYGAAYPRPTVGCDRTLTVKLHVLPITTYPYSAVECKDSYTWTFTVNNDVNPTPATVVVTRAQYGYGPHDVLYPYTPGGRPPQGFSHQCQRELHTLHINFIRPNETSPKTVELCQDGAPLVVNKTSDPDIADDEFEWIFTPKDSLPGVYYSDKIECVNSDNCPYYMQYKIIVNRVEMHRDTVVYCYEDGSRVEHKWEGHASFWGNIKGQPNTKKRYNANTPLRIDRPKADKTKDTRVIYELADTIPGNPCHIVYSQTVILLPPYSTSEKGKPISTEQWFEWHDVIWAGEKADLSTIPSGGKQVVVLQEYGQQVPEGWKVTYVKGDNLFALTTTTTTRQYQRDDGSLTTPCDSTVELAVRVADVQREHTYAWVCSNETPYEWKAGDTIIYINLEDHYQIVNGKPQGLPKTIYLEEHRKTVEDPKRTTSPWPVAGIDAYFYRDLTIYPAYVTTEDSAACQAPGETVVFKGIPFSLDKDTTLVAGNKLKTQPKYWTKPDAGPDEDPLVKVECDSIEGVRLFVRPIYTEAVNKERSTYKHEFYSHDTVSFFTNPRVLFVGKDFFEVHPDIKDIEDLKRIAQVDSALVIDETLVPELGEEGSKGGVYHGLQVSDGTHGDLSCDSTTFLDLTIFKTKIIAAVDLGDNGDVLNGGTTDEWKFGGDTTVARADGTRYHTCPLMTGDYFHFYYDANGNIIGEVDYYDPDDDPNNRRASHDYHYSENNDGTRTYLLIDTVLNADGTQDVYVQHVIVYPTYLVDANTSESLGTVEVCASDTYHWEGHRNIVVSDLPLNNRQARVEDPLCAKRYEDRGICVDSICILELTVFGNANVPQKRHHCFNDTVWKWRNKDSIYYDADAPISGQIRDTIRPHDSDEHNCYDVYTLDVIFDPAYGVAPYKGYNNQYHYTYVDPYISKDTVVCYETDDFRWLLKTGEEHVPSNLYLYKYDGNKNDVPDNRYTDALGNPTNKIPDNKVPTDLPHSVSGSKKFYTVRDSLLTVGCFCDSVLTLSYEIIEAMPEQTIEQTICKGESYDFDGETLTEPGKYEKYIQKEGQPCKTWTTLYLTVEEKATTVKVDSALVCFGDPESVTTYALRYSYKGNHPNSYSVSYKEDAQGIGFEDIEERPINRPEREWKADSVYVLDLPLPRLDTRKDYPMPGEYHASISFKNEVCTGSSLMTYDFKMKVNYPAWVMEQRHNDLIVLLDADYNGGHAWNRFEWFKNGDRLPGYTKPYLYIPEGLLVGNEQTAEYHAVLTETDALGNVISSAPTCPIVVKAGLPNSPTNPDKDHGPSSDYISVTPTCVPRGGGIHILSLNANSSGEYRITTVDGQFISKGEYHGKSTPVSIPSVEGMYIVQVWSSDKESKESYRAIKVIVKDTCPNCDKSSF